MGLDSDIRKIPKYLLKVKYPQFAFNKAIIDATADLVCAFKPNSAFYEAWGASGVAELKRTCDYLHETTPDIIIILDAKRADIGSTNEGYVQYAFDWLGVDAITLHPYLGKEALKPFLARKDKGCIILCRTSNPGAGELQNLEFKGKPLYQVIAEKVSQEWNTQGNCGLVVGATYSQELNIVRRIAKDLPLLIPGVGSQGGDLTAVLKNGLDAGGSNVIINVSRSVIFASPGADFAQKARAVALKYREEINQQRK